jgi:proteasome beta subunit
VKLGFRDGLDRAEAVDLALSSLWQAADEDSATGGPDLVRGIFPVMATITEAGFERVDAEEIRSRFEELIDRLRSAEGTTFAGGAPQMGGDLS